MSSETNRKLTLACLTALLVLATGCHRELLPGEVTATPVGAVPAAAEEAIPEEGDLIQDDAIEATAIANSTAIALSETPEQEPAAPTAVPTQAPTATSPPVITAAPTNTPLMITPAPTFTPMGQGTTPTPEAAASTSEPASATSEPGEEPAATGSGSTVHVVQRGENLFRIALRYGTTVQAISNANGIANPSMIYVGQKLVVPTAGTSQPPATGDSTYVVQRGENLYRIALRYNMSWLTLARYNGISNPSNIYAGQVLRIPPH